MNAGVDDQPAGAPHFVGQAPHILGRRIIKLHLDAEPLRIKTPAFDKRGEKRTMFAEVGHVQFLLQRDLLMMTGYRLVDA